MGRGKERERGRRRRIRVGFVWVGMRMVGRWLMGLGIRYVVLVLVLFF